MRAIGGTSVAGLILLLQLGGCADSGPNPAVPARAADPLAERWGLARDAFIKSDFDQTLRQLNIIKDQARNPESGVDAAVWRTLMLGGLARGYAEMIVACERGIEGSGPAVQRELEVERGGYFRGARIYGLQLLETATLLDSQLQAEDTVRMNFPLPAGDYRPSPVWARIASGLRPEQGFMTEAVDYTLRRNVFLQAADMIGAHGDLERTRSLFAQPPVVVPKSVYFLGVAHTLQLAQDMFIDTRIRNREARDQLLSAAELYAQPATQSGGRTLQDAAADLLAEIRATQTAIEKERQRLGGAP